MTVWVGRELSRVRIQKLIGRGGTAEVYLGLHTTLQRPVAVKILHAYLAEAPDLVRRFRAEAHAAASLRHPNIVQIHDYDVADGQPYLILELLDGPTLSAYLDACRRQGHTLPFETIIRLMNDIAGALDHAHGLGVVHRDVKPANIVLRRGGSPIDLNAPLPIDAQAVLTDFGIARVANAATLTTSGSLLGTPAYMSPEQIIGKPVDARADVYAVGVMLYEMLTGRLPFDSTDETPVAMLYQHVHEPPPALEGASPALRAVIDRALAKDPEARYGSAGALAADLRAALQSARRTWPIRPGQREADVTTLVLPRDQARRRTRRTLAAGAVGLVTLAAVSWLALARPSLLPGGSRAASATATSPAAFLPSSTRPSGGPIATLGPTQSATPTNTSNSSAASPATNTGLPGATGAPGATATQAPSATQPPSSTPASPPTATPTPVLPLPTLPTIGLPP